MFKHIVHLIFFAVGACVGIWWGVNHPTQAKDLTDTEQARIQQAVAEAKQQVLQTVKADQATAPGGVTANPAAASHLQQMIQQAQSEYNAAKVKLGQ